MAGPTKYQLDFQYRTQRLQVVRSFGFYVLIAVLGALFFHCIYQCVRELAGKQTTASILLNLYAALKAPRALAVALAYTLAALASAWGYGERRGKKRAIARLHPMARQAQVMLDANKGSSNITLSGDTGPGDE